MNRVAQKYIKPGQKHKSLGAAEELLCDSRLQLGDPGGENEKIVARGGEFTLLPSLDCVTMDIVAFFFLSVGAEIWEFFNSLIEFRMM